MSVLPNGCFYPKKSFVILCYRSPEPKLRSPYLGLLRGQLGYWFSKYPQGFYKFLEPCKHKLYRVGDSWTEELGFSRRIFNAAFDLIGVRYKSKTAFMNAEDKFQGKLYASYHDRKTNRTFFVRNCETPHQHKKLLSVKKPTSHSSASPSIAQEGKYINQGKATKKSGNDSLLSNRSRNDTKRHSYGGIIGGKNIITKNTPSSLAGKVDRENSDDFTESKKIAEEIKNIWIEEIGEPEINQLSLTLISKINHSYSTVFDSSLEKWRTYCRQIASSQFLMGEKRGTNFKARLSWAIKPESFDRIQAGDFTLGDRNTHKAEKIRSLSAEEEKNLNETFSNSLKNPLWIKVGLELLKRVGGYTFNQWFKDLDINSYQSNEIKFKSPSLFHRDYINRNYRDQLVASLEKVLGHKVFHLSYSV